MPSATLLRPGDVIGGFEVEDLIGIGGMATVYRARQASLGRAVALKVLSRQLTGDEVFRERFRREGMHAASLEHPNIVPVYDSGEQDGLLYLAMRLVDGQSLAELLATRGVTADRAIEVLAPIASALDCAHAAGLIHRDVKPQNILITNQGHPYLADFGVAKGADSQGLTATGGFVGSVNYASPEQIKGLTLTAASDVYALTAVLYHCLSGDVPYPGESEAGVMHAHLHEPPPTLPALEGADSDFHTVFARGMAKDPGARYGHAGDLMNAAAVCVSRMPSARRRAIPAFPARPRAAGPQPDSPEAAGAAETVAPSVVPESLTAADRRRDPPPPDPPAESPRRRLPRRPQMPSVSAPLRRLPRPRLPKLPRASRQALVVAGGAVALVAVVVVAIAVLGGGTGGASATPVRKGSLALSYESPWRPAPVAAAARTGVGFHAPIELRGPGGEALVAGKLTGAAPVPGGAPPALATQLDRKPSRQLVHLGPVEAVRYTATAGRGKRTVTMYVVPTASGDLGLLCTGASVGAAVGSCAKSAATLRVIGLEPVAPGADKALAARMRSPLRAVAKAHGHDAHLLASASAPKPRAIRAIASADVGAAKGLSSASAEPRDRGAVRALASALRREAKALTTTAAAAGRRDYAKYAQAVESTRAAGVAAAAAGLRRIGFDVPALRPLTLPPLRRPRPRPETVTAVSSEAPVESTPSVGAPISEPAPAPAPTSSGPPHVIVTAPK